MIKNNFIYKDELRNKLQKYINTITTADKKIKDHYICPICNSGTGRKKTGGFSYFVDNSNIPRATCFSCGKVQNSDIFELIGEIEAITDFNEQYNRACDIFGYNNLKTKENKIMKNNKNKTTDPIKEKSVSIPDNMATSVKSDYKDFFLQAHSNVNKTNYLMNRGISQEIIEKQNIGYVDDWKYPSKDNMYAKSVIIIPVTDNSYVARDIDPKANIDYRIFKVGTTTLYNTDDLYNDNKPVFIVEGEIDALSLMTVGAKVVALGSVSNANKLIIACQKKTPTVPLILSLDNDNAGIEITKNIIDNLKKINVSFIDKNISGEYKDPNECLIKDKLAFVENVKIAEQQANEKVSNKQIIKNVKNIFISSDLIDVSMLNHNPDDLGNAERLINTYGNIVKYCSEIGKWYIYDNKYWKTDENGAIYRKAWEIIRTYQNTVNINFKEIKKNTVKGTEKDNIEFQMANSQLKWSKSSAFINRIEAMIKVIGQLRFVSQNELDIQSNYITCENGTINLETGLLMEHNLENLITKKINVSYNSHARCPEFQKFLNRIFNNDIDLIRYIQIALGYTMTGETREQCFFIAYGTGSNGKSTLFDIISYILNDYTQSIPTVVLMDNQKKGSEVSPELARAKGKRFVIASESKDLATLNENQIKSLTGGDMIAVRPLYGQGFEYKPTYKIWLGTNHKPVIKGTDNGIWRRVKMIPFSVTIPDEEQDKLLPEKLKAESEGILAWLILGANYYYTSGLLKNKTIDEATKEYREEMDILGEFLSDCIEEKKESTVTSKLLYETYKNHCYENGIEPISNTSFGRKLIERGLKKGKTSIVYYSDINLTKRGKELSNPKFKEIQTDFNAFL